MLLAIGRRGTPRKLDVPGEQLEKVTYRLIEPEQYRGQKCLVVGGGDMAIETALMLAAQPGTTVTLAHRGEKFDRCKPENYELLEKAEIAGKLSVKVATKPLEIAEEHVLLEGRRKEKLPNDYVFVCIGGELPTAWLAKIGVEVKTLRGEGLSGRAIMKLRRDGILCIATNAAAYTTGISGYSGKDGVTCTECHAAGAVQPSALLQGPASLAPGTTGTYQLLVDTDVNSAASAKRTVGIDVATSGGTLGTVNQVNQTRLLAGEVSHTNALPQGKTVQVSFTLTAPAQAGKVTLFAAALSADGDGSNRGDSTATTTMDVQIGVSSSPPDLDVISTATMTAPPDHPDAGPPQNEPRWSCGSYVGVPLPVAGAPVAAVFLVVLLLRRRRA